MGHRMFDVSRSAPSPLGRRRRAISALARVACLLAVGGGCEDDTPAPLVENPPARATAAAPTVAPRPEVSSAPAPPSSAAPRTEAAPDAGAGGAPDGGGAPAAPSSSAGPVVAPPSPSASATASAAPPAPAPTEPPAPAIPAPAAGSADAVAVAVDDVYLGHGTFKAKFKQTHTQKVAGVEKTSTGVVFVERPNKISFRYDPPNKNRIVSDGTTLKVYVADDEQMVVQPVANTEYPGALAFIMGKGLHPSFTFTFNEKAKFEGGPILLGTPRTATPHYKNVLFYIDDALLAKKSANTVRRVLIVDTQGNRNRFDFTEATYPPTIPASEFTFSPPPGTNIVQP